MKKLFLALLLLCPLAAHAAPPATWQVGTMVYFDVNNTPFSHLLQFPGSPVDCTDTFDGDWCLWMNCSTVPTSTYTCTDVPLASTCVAVQVAANVAKSIVNADANACFK